MELSYTYWQEKDGWYLGYLNDYPDHWTQGKTLAELEEMLRDWKAGSIPRSLLRRESFI
jgi:predicted RNase H-like HicB family nuclease